MVVEVEWKRNLTFFASSPLMRRWSSRCSTACTVAEDRETPSTWPRFLGRKDTMRVSASVRT